MVDDAARFLQPPVVQYPEPSVARGIPQTRLGVKRLWEASHLGGTTVRSGSHPFLELRRQSLRRLPNKTRLW
jgi:hypothetical protein